MITIQEYKSGNESYYKKIIETDTDSNESMIYYRAECIKKDDADYYMLYNTNMEVVSDVFSYINYYLSEKSVNTRIKSFEALKFLFAFEEIIEKKLCDFTMSDVISLKYFLHGYSPSGNMYKMNLITIRSNLTVNGYLSIYRSFLQFLNIEQHPLLIVDNSFSKPIETSADTIIKTKRYNTNDRMPIQKVEVPKYISVEEFAKILEIVRAHYDLKTEIIIRLMYQCGLRLGEVFGLTADDLIMQKRDTISENVCYSIRDSYVPVAYIRNRTSDSKDQKAKSCMKIVSQKQYRTNDYHLHGYGYQFVVLPTDLFELINDYIEEAHSLAREKSPERYYAKTIADRVEESDIYEDDNYYIFINSIGTPLSASTWNTQIRKIFSMAGIPVDKQKRKNNLNHRFRHGFAMFQVMYCHTNAAKLADLLRHSSLSSVMRYYKPTISDQIALKTKALDDMYDAIPQLKRKE